MSNGSNSEWMLCAPCNDLPWRMPHIGCGADILRWRREKAAEIRRLQSLGLLPITEEFKPAKNAQYPHQTNARDPDVFNARRCSWTKLAQAQKTYKEKSRSGSSTSPTSPLSSSPSPYKPQLAASNPSMVSLRSSALLRTQRLLSVESSENEG